MCICILIHSVACLVAIYLKFKKLSARPTYHWRQNPSSSPAKTRGVHQQQLQDGQSIFSDLRDIPWYSKIQQDTMSFWMSLDDIRRLRMGWKRRGNIEHPWISMDFREAPYCCYFPENLPRLSGFRSALALRSRWGQLGLFDLVLHADQSLHHSIIVSLYQSLSMSLGLLLLQLQDDILDHAPSFTKARKQTEIYV